MANLTPTAGWDDVPQLETTTPALGGAGAVMNSQAQALVNRFGATIRRLTLAELDALDSDQNTVVFVTDASGGLMQRDASDTSSANDGGSYTGTIRRSADYATRGVWKRIGGGPVYSTERARGEQPYVSSGEIYFALSNNVIDSQETGTGTDYTPGATYTAIKVTTSAEMTFMQGINLRVKKTGSLTQGSYLAVALYTDNAGVPDTSVASGGKIFAGQVTASYQELTCTLQNVTNDLDASTPYWVVITRSESGGAFVLDSDVGSGDTYEGAALASLSDTSKVIYRKLQARTKYPVHVYAENSHGVWTRSGNAVAVRGDSNTHYGGYFTSTSGHGLQGVSTYGKGGIFQSSYDQAVLAQTFSTLHPGIYGANYAASGAYPGVQGYSESGAGVIAQTKANLGYRAYALWALAGGIRMGSGGDSTEIRLLAADGPPSGFTSVARDTFLNSHNNPGGALLYSVVTAGTPGVFGTVNLQGVSSDQGDAAVAATYDNIENTIIFDTPLTSDRTFTIQTTGLGTADGARKRVVRTAASIGAFNLIVSGLLGGASKNLAAGQWADIEYSRKLGNGWIVTASGSL